VSISFCWSFVDNITKTETNFPVHITERERERERATLIGKMKMKMKTTSVLVLSCALVCSSVGVALAKNATKADVLTKEQCTENVPYQEFATDNRIISCVRNASESCCEAMDELLGEESPVHYCTCSSGVLEDVLSEAVPMFATDIIHERIEECGLPVAGDERCDGIYDDSDQAKPTGDCVDEYPPDVDTQYTCEDQAGFGKCEENWMDGYCQFSCGKCESDQVQAEGEASSSGDEEEEVSDEDVLLAEDGEVLANGTLVLANCTDEKNPIDDSRHDCAAQKDFGKCEEGWMDGYCLLSCGKCIKPATRQVAAAASVLNSKANSTDDPTGDMIETESNSTAACVDEYPPDVDTQYTCEDQAGFGKCEENWMDGYCLLSCEKCSNATDSKLS